jgi:hypothetical protein
MLEGLHFLRRKLPLLLFIAVNLLVCVTKVNKLRIFFLLGTSLNLHEVHEWVWENSAWSSSKARAIRVRTLLVILDCNLLLLDGLSFLDSRITTCDGFLIHFQSRLTLIDNRILLPISRSLSPSVPMLRISLVCCSSKLKRCGQIFSSHRLRTPPLLIACVR